MAVLALAFACSESPTEATLDDLAPQFAKGGKPGKQDPPPGTPLGDFILPVFSDGSSPPGLYSDQVDGIFADEPLDQALIVDCDLGSFVLERPGTWAIVPGNEIHCSGRDGFSRLDLNGMTSLICDTPDGCSIGTTTHDDSGLSFGPDTNYYFRVVPSGKKGGKGNFTSYNVVWIDARFTSDQARIDGIACSWHLWADNAEFWERAGEGDVQLDQIRAIALDVVIERQDPNCP